MKRAGTSGNRMGLAEFCFARAQGYDRTRDGSDDRTRRKNGERVKSVTKKARREAIRHREAAAQRRPEVCEGLPGNVASIFYAGAEQFISARGVELAAGPSERSQSGKALDESQGRWRRVHSRRRSW